MTEKLIKEALEQHHLIVAVTYNGTTIISSQHLEVKLLKHSETCILNGNGYIKNIARTLMAKNPPRMSMLGGLTPRLKSWLADNIKANLAEPLHEPEVGSVLFARQQQAKHSVQQSA